VTTTSPINGLPIPSGNSDGWPPEHFQALATALDDKLNARFASTAERDAAIPNPTKNMECWVDGVGKQINANGTTAGWRTKFDDTPWPMMGRLTGTAQQAIKSDGSYHAVLLDVVDKLTTVTTVAGTGKLVVPYDGWWRASGAAHFQGQTAGGTRRAAIFRNNAVVSWSQSAAYPPDTSECPVATASIPVSCHANDFIQLAAYQNSGNDNLLVDRTQSFISLEYMGPL
jgi:hypothetical protein